MPYKELLALIERAGLLPLLAATSVTWGYFLNVSGFGFLVSSTSDDFCGRFPLSRFHFWQIEHKRSKSCAGHSLTFLLDAL